MQVLPTAPSPTVTHFMNLDALILFRPPSRYRCRGGEASWFFFLLLVLWGNKEERWKVVGGAERFGSREGKEGGPEEAGWRERAAGG